MGRGAAALGRAVPLPHSRRGLAGPLRGETRLARHPLGLWVVAPVGPLDGDQNPVGPVRQAGVDLLPEARCSFELHRTAPSVWEDRDQLGEEVGSTNSPQAKMAPDHLPPWHP